MSPKRLDFETIEDVIPENSRVLDLGCGDGTLLAKLVTEKSVTARGVEISEENVRLCISKGLSVRHGNIEDGLADYRDKTFDFVILSQTLAFLDRPYPVIKEMLRVGKAAIISFENAGYWLERVRVLLGKGMGLTLCSGEPRQRLITLTQFDAFVKSMKAHIENRIFLSGNRPIRNLCTLRAMTAVFVLAED